MTNNYNFIARLITIVAIVIVLASVSVVIWYPGDPVPVITQLIAYGSGGALLIAQFKQSFDNGVAQQQTAAKVEIIETKVDQVKEDTFHAVALVAQIGTVASETQSQVAVNTEITDKTHVAVNSRMDQLIDTVEALGKAQKELAAEVARAQGIKEGRAQVQAETTETPQ